MILFDPEKLKRYKDFTFFILKHPNIDIIRQPDGLNEVKENKEKENAEKYVRDIEQLDPAADLV